MTSPYLHRPIRALEQVIKELQGKQEMPAVIEPQAPAETDKPQITESDL